MSKTVIDESEPLKLYRQIIEGQSSAEECLIRRYRDGVSIIINGIVRNSTVCEDLTQEAFMIVLRKIRKGEVREPERISGFIRSVARNHAIRYLRTLRRAASQEETSKLE